MFTKALSRNTHENHLIRLVMVIALLFAALHIALHELDMGSGLDEHDKCQVCRLSHSPATSLPVPSLSSPLQFLIYLAFVNDTKFQVSNSFHAQWARAPPLF